MFERFTSSSRRAMVLANVAARERGHGFIGGAHLALAFLEVDRQAAAGLFARLGVEDVDDLRAALEAEADREAGDSSSKGPPSRAVRVVGSGAGVSVSPPFTPEAKKALEMALREAVNVGQNWIGLGHMLLGLINSAASTVLVERLPLDRARDIVAAWEADQPISEQAAGPPDERGDTLARGFSEVMKAAMTKASKPVGSHHLLLGMFEVDNTLAGKVLESLGVTEEKVRAAIESIGTAGTIDAPPPQQVEIRASGRTVTIDADALRAVLGFGGRSPDKLAEIAEKVRGVLDPPQEPQGS